jgi:hypothetical protein
MQIEHLDSRILYVSDLSGAKAFYADALQLPVIVEDEIIAVVNGPSRVVLAPERSRARRARHLSRRLGRRRHGGAVHRR